MLKTRILSAIVMVSVLLLVLFALPPMATLVLATIVLLAAAWEWGALWSGDRHHGRFAAVLVMAALLPLAWWLARTPVGLRTLLWLAALWWLAALLWLMLAPQRVSRAAAVLAGVLTLLPTWVALIHLRIDYAQGASWLLLAIAIVAAADIGAYFVGRRFGRVKLAPRVSPGKTWEGVGGGLLLALLVAFGGAATFGAPAIPMLAAALAAASFSVVGDLTESMLKRHAGFKDSGSLLPGHGGVLDRVDSISAGVPVLLLCWLQFGVLR